MTASTCLFIVASQNKLKYHQTMKFVCFPRVLYRNYTYFVVISFRRCLHNAFMVQKKIINSLCVSISSSYIFFPSMPILPECVIIKNMLKQIYTRTSGLKNITLPKSFTSFYGAELTVGAIQVSLKFVHWSVSQIVYTFARYRSHYQLFIFTLCNTDIYCCVTRLMSLVSKVKPSLSSSNFETGTK